MKGRKNIIICACALVFFAALVGFFITYDVSVQIAYARLFIDIGLMVGLVSLIMALYKAPELPMGTLLHALSCLKSGIYKTRLNTDGLGPLTEIALSINDLAHTLQEKEKPIEPISQRPILTSLDTILPNATFAKRSLSQHSHHPELGPVQAIPEEPVPEKATSVTSVHPPLRSAPLESLHPKNAVTEEPPPSTAIPNPLAQGEVLPKESKAISEQPAEMPVVSIPPKMSDYPEPVEALYQRFSLAQHQHALEITEFHVFQNIVLKSRQELAEQYRCRYVNFDVVHEGGEVALRPRLVR